MFVSSINHIYSVRLSLSQGLLLRSVTATPTGPTPRRYNLWNWMDPLNSNTKDTGVIEYARHRRRERDRARAALMTDEQREEKNRKRREAYKRKQCHAHNKENLTNMVHQMNMVHPAPALLQSTNISTRARNQLAHTYTGFKESKAFWYFRYYIFWLRNLLYLRVNLLRRW